MQTGISWQVFKEVPNIKFHLNPASGSCADTCRQTYKDTDGRMDMTKATDAFRDYANAPKNVEP